LSFRSFVLLIYPSGVCSLLDFLCSWDHFLGGGMPPVVAPEGGLVFWGKPSCPLTLLI
jgi:hypothetical protein